MKVLDFTPAIAVTADQQHSRRDRDRVPAALAALRGLPDGDVLLDFERTAGDEVQGLVAHGPAAVRVVRALTRLGGWRIGLGVGPVEVPLPASTRAARGPGYVAAREAVDAARGCPGSLAVRTAVRSGDDSVGGAGEDVCRPAADAETTLWLVLALWRRRTAQGWVAVDLLDSGLTGREAARSLGITPSAVSQRAAAAARVEAGRGARRAARLLDEAVAAT